MAEETLAQRPEPAIVSAWGDELVVLARFEGKSGHHKFCKPFTAWEEGGIFDILTMLDDVFCIRNQDAVTDARPHAARPHVAQVMIATSGVNGRNGGISPLIVVNSAIVAMLDNGLGQIRPESQCQCHNDNQKWFVSCYRVHEVFRSSAGSLSTHRLASNKHAFKVIASENNRSDPCAYRS